MKQSKEFQQACPVTFPSEEPGSCTRCGRCVRSCAFLKEYGSPGELLALDGVDQKHLYKLAYLCSLCGLCTALCKDGCDPAGWFLSLRERAVRDGAVDFSPYRGLLTYESLGVSKFLTWAHLPKGCDTIFFPGCGLSGTRHRKVMTAWNYLKGVNPHTGLVLDCCTKPSHDLGRRDSFERAFGELHGWLVENGIRRVIVACPNCHKVFSRYGGGLETRSIYEVMAEDPALTPEALGEDHGIHHSCATRFEGKVQRAVTHLALRTGARISGREKEGLLTRCCGEGGAVESVCGVYPGLWRKEIATATDGLPLISACSGCASRLDGKHVLDLYFNHTERDAKISRSPKTYLNRWRLKSQVKQESGADVTRSRHIRMSESGRSGAMKLGLGLALAAVITIAHMTGLTGVFHPEVLGGVVDGLGIYGPLLYVLIYWIACCLFLPASPLTIGAAMLFGPAVGLAVSMAGAVGGAAFAFFIARYLASDWVTRRIAGTPLAGVDARLDGESGWKVVALFRLVPLFPFPVVNIAMGITRVRFLPYLVMTALCMFPATAAITLFSSSILDLLTGRPGVSLLIGGVMLAAVVGLSSFLKRRYNRKVS